MAGACDLGLTLLAGQRPVQDGWRRETANKAVLNADISVDR
jgi:hypothetical protein